MLTDEQKKGLSLMRKPFKQNQISKLPKPTKQQTEAVRQDYRIGMRCALCGAWHHKDVIHLDYVGHAALTDRLLDCDPEWNYTWLAQNEITGAPEFDKFGGAWIALTVCGVTRLGYGSAEGKTGPDSMKEIIGDALRNAAMRFGAALDLWHKGDLHVEDDGKQASQEAPYKAPPKSTEPNQEKVDNAVCTDETFKKNQQAWFSLVDSGKKSANDLITWLSAKYTLTEQQQLTIESWEQQ